MKFTNIPYRRWRHVVGNKFVLVENAAYKRVMKRVGEAISLGMSVEMDHQIVNPEPAKNKPYDTITVTITP